MTIDEAISIMNVIVHMLEPQYDTDRIEEAVEMAIKALKHQVTDAVDRVTIKEYLESFGTDTNVTATDCISREAVIKTITEWLFSKEFYYTNATEYLRKRLDELPPVTPQPKMGRWIEHFDEICKWYE